MLSAIREVQIPLLALMLLGGCAAKLWRVLRARSVEAGLGPTVLFPLHLRRSVNMAICVSELILGFAMIATAGRAGAGLAATVVRVWTALLFVTAIGALVELRARRPDVGCGCFGDLSATPVSMRTVSRSALLAAAAVITIGVPPLGLPPTGSAALLQVTVLAVELTAIAALSPELGETLIRLGYSEPCELRRLPVERTLAALHASALWRRHADVIISQSPTDIWRDMCWRYVVYPGNVAGRTIEVVFAVYLRPRRPPIRTALVDAVTDEVLTGPAAPRQLRVAPVPAGTPLPAGARVPACPCPVGDRNSAVPATRAPGPAADSSLTPSDARAWPDARARPRARRQQGKSAAV